MRCAGVVHGDLSEFNVLPAAHGRVIVDLPQAVDAAGNDYGQRMLLRDVANLSGFFGQVAPELLSTNYGEEIWNLYERGELHTGSALTASFVQPRGPVDLGGVLDDARGEEAARLMRMAAR